MILIWFVAGVMVGMALAYVTIGLYGDTELNENIRELRKARYNMQLAKTKYRLLHTYNWWRKQK